MGFGAAVKSCLQRNYAGFRGRAPRSEYWYFALFNWLVMAGLFLLAAGLGYNGAGRFFGVALAIYMLGVVLPSIAVSVRRLHDRGASGVWYLITLVPGGGLGLMIHFCFRGNAGDNRFGPDPLESVADAFS